MRYMQKAIKDDKQRGGGGEGGVEMEWSAVIH